MVTKLSMKPVFRKYNITKTNSLSSASSNDVIFPHLFSDTLLYNSSEARKPNYFNYFRQYWVSKPFKYAFSIKETHSSDGSDEYEQS